MPSWSPPGADFVRSEYEVGGIRAREVQMPAHDETNIVLIEILSGGYEMKYSPAGYAALTSFVVIVPSTKIEASFYADLFDLDELMHHRITGPEIEKAVGLPSGTALDMRLMGREGNFFGRSSLSNTRVWKVRIASQWQSRPPWERFTALSRSIRWIGSSSVQRKWVLRWFLTRTSRRSFVPGPFIPCIRRPGCELKSSSEARTSSSWGEINPAPFKFTYRRK